MDQKEEHNLFDRIRKGDEEAFNKAFNLFYSPLCFFTDKFLHDLDASRSLVQQLYVDLWIKREKLLVISLKSYLYHSARNAAIDVLKHKNVESKYFSSLQHEEVAELNDWIEEAELSDRINRAIQKLPDRCREIFILCRFEEMKYAEIADRLNISVKTVEMQMCIALKKLRKELTDSQMFQLLYLFSSKKILSLYRVN